MPQNSEMLMKSKIGVKIVDGAISPVKEDANDQRMKDREEKRLHLAMQLDGDAGEKEENEMKTALMTANMKKLKVDAQARLIKKNNIELETAFARMQELTGTSNLNDIVEGFLTRESRHEEMEVQAAILKERIRNDKEIAKELSDELFSQKLVAENGANSRKVMLEADTLADKIIELEKNLELRRARANSAIILLQRSSAGLMQLHRDILFATASHRKQSRKDHGHDANALAKSASEASVSSSLTASGSIKVPPVVTQETATAGRWNNIESFNERLSSLHRLVRSLVQTTEAMENKDVLMKKMLRSDDSPPKAGTKNVRVPPGRAQTPQPLGESVKKVDSMGTNGDNVNNRRDIKRSSALLIRQRHHHHHHHHRQQQQQEQRRERKSILTRKAESPKPAQAEAKYFDSTTAAA